MNLPDNEFLLWHQNRWVPVCKTDLRNGDVFIARGLRNPKGSRVVMRMKDNPRELGGGSLEWVLEFTRGTKAQQQSDVPPPVPREALPPCPRCNGVGVIYDTVLDQAEHPCPLCQPPTEDEYYE